MTIKIIIKMLVLFLIITSHHNVLAAGTAGIATAHPLATKAGVEILQTGGNAFDAAVAISAMLGVVEPYSSGIGGGGFYLFYIAKQDRYVFIDAREKAPSGAHKDMYLDDKGEVIANISINGPLSAGIPGIVAALEHISERYGKNTLKQNLQASIKVAEDGFEVNRVYKKLAKWRESALNQYPLSQQTFLPLNKVPAIGEVIKQKDLAKTLTIIANDGADAFYKGKIAKEMVSAVQQAGGIWQLQDLANYQVIEREPIKIKLGSNTLYSAPLPSSGGIVLAQMLQQLAALPIKTMPEAHTEAKNIHFIIEAMRRAYRDRAVYLGDSDFVKVPVEQLLSPNYAKGLTASIHPNKASKSSAFSVTIDSNKSHHTTHFSIVDSEGNKVATTLSINYPFGSGFIAGKTGVLLNDEMDDFVAKPNTANVYGLVGGKANAIEPNKRMLSSMSPSILTMPDKTVILGTPGGSRIITMVLLGVMAALEGKNAQEIVNQKRFHHQFLPDEVSMENNAISKVNQAKLSALGHTLKQRSDWGNMQLVIEHKNTKVESASDNRGVGLSWVGQIK